MVLIKLFDKIKNYDKKNIANISNNLSYIFLILNIIYIIISTIIKVINEFSFSSLLLGYIMHIMGFHEKLIDFIMQKIYRNEDNINNIFNYFYKKWIYICNFSIWNDTSMVNSNMEEHHKHMDYR